jgi:hypothetical protein
MMILNSKYIQFSIFRDIIYILLNFNEKNYEIDFKKLNILKNFFFMGFFFFFFNNNNKGKNF